MRRIVLVSLIALLGLALLADGTSRPTAAQAGKVGEGVIDALQTQGYANVVVALAEPPSARAPQIVLPTLRSEIASLQDGVLSELAPSDLIVKHQYEAVPGLAGRVTEAGLADLVADPNVVRIDLDVGGTASLATSVPLIDANEWHVHGTGITGANVVVAVLDTGLDTDHADLADDLIHQECFGDNDGAINGAGFCPNGSDRQSGAGAAEDGQGHGTHVTGIITSRANVSPVAVAPDADIVSIKVIDNSGIFFYFSEIVAALDFIINNRPDVQVINMSLGTSALFAGNCDNATAYNIAGAAAINTLRANGVVSFAASGNDGSGTQMSSPACIANVLSVGATDKLDNLWGSTNRNATLDMLAPGVNITSTGLANATDKLSGTSMASPHAAGCAALFIEAGVATTPDQIETRLETSPVIVAGFPRIDCFERGDYGDADPQYPVKLADNGARHLDTTNEWFGRFLKSHDDSVSEEFDAIDPVDPDGTPNLREDISGWDLDRFDDGVLFFPLTYQPGARGKVEFNVCIEDFGAGYDPSDPDMNLYVNAWVDWDTDFDWEEANAEHVIDGLKLAPKDAASWGPLGVRAGTTTVTKIAQAADNKCARYKAEFDVGATIGTGEMWARFRIDHGEDVGRNDPRPMWVPSASSLRDPNLAENVVQPAGQGIGYTRGAAHFGEVEDYLLGTDFGDAPDPYTAPNQYPTRKNPNGGRHLDFNREWLGPPGIYASATREVDGCDTTLAEEDRIPNLGASCSSSDEDRKEDGAAVPTDVFPGQVLNIDIDVSAKVDSFGYANRGPGGEDSAGVLTLKPNCALGPIPNEEDTPLYHRDRGRYSAWDPERRLYLNVWADWNANGIWEDGELVINGPLDPEDWGTDGKYTLGERFVDNDGNEVRTPDEPYDDVAGIPTRHLTCPVQVPYDVAAVTEFWWRFRVDYGENVTTNDNVVHHATEDSRALVKPLGGALWGEVEDYPMSTIEVDDFCCSKAEVTINIPSPPGPPVSDTVTLTGPTTVEVDLASLLDSDGDGLEEVQTEIVQMELTGTSALLGPVTVRIRDSAASPFQPTIGEIEETDNDTPGILDIPPFTATGTADSFFDVFFEIEAPGAPPGLTLLHNGDSDGDGDPEPKRMETPISEKPPAPGETYESPSVIPLLDESNNPTGVEIAATFHTPNPIPPPGPPVVGGIVELLGQAESPADPSGSASSRDYTAPLAAAAAVAAFVALAAGGWYARRRWLR